MATKDAEYSTMDFPYLMTWAQVKKVCSNLENDWRIPTSEELKRTLVNGKDSVVMFWASDIFSSNQPWKFDTRKWQECAPGYHTYVNLLRVVKES